MIVLVDTSIWRRHFRDSDDHLVEKLKERRVVTHDMVLLELVISGVTSGIRRSLSELRRLPSASGDEVLAAVDVHRLAQNGMGLVDAHLFFAAMRGGAALYTADRALASAFAPFQPAGWRT